MAVLDIDRFKQVNDTYGHTIGDEAIKFIAAHLTAWNPHYDISIVRYGGDEFIILMPYPLSDMEQELLQLHEKIMSTPLYVEKLQMDIPISISIGVGHTKDDYYTIDLLFEKADTAIYKAKESRSAIVMQEMDTQLN